MVTIVRLISITRTINHIDKPNSRLQSGSMTQPKSLMDLTQFIMQPLRPLSIDTKTTNKTIKRIKTRQKIRKNTTTYICQTSVCRPQARIHISQLSKHSINLRLELRGLSKGRITRIDNRFCPLAEKKFHQISINRKRLQAKKIKKGSRLTL